MKRFVFLILILLQFFSGSAQEVQVTIFGVVKDQVSKTPLAYVNVIVKNEMDSAFVAGTISKDDGSYQITNLKPGTYILETSYIGYETKSQSIVVGKLSKYLDFGTIELTEKIESLDEVVVAGSRDAISETMDKKTFDIASTVTQSGGSLLQVMQTLPGVMVSQDGKVLLRGSDRVAILIDGKQTALTGMGGQTGLDNIPASAIERIEIINNPSAKFDANGNAGIINIIYKKGMEDGMNGKAGLSLGVGALWVKRENYPTIRPQYQATPKVNPSLSLNYKKNKLNWFFQADDLYTETLNKNEFVDRYYDNGDTVRQQTKRNRDTNIITGKTGVDWNANEKNTFTISGLFSSEKIIDNGDEPFFNSDLTERYRLWQFLEDELKTTVTAFAGWNHKFDKPGKVLNMGYNYTFHREDEQYFFTNTMPTFVGEDSFKLLSDEHVNDFTVDYIQPLKHGRFETGIKFRYRIIPTNMEFFPGDNSPIDSTAGGWADYSEIIPALYGNYFFENEKFEIEAGVRMEYVNIYYEVNPDHNTYESSGYDYTEPFPNLRVAYKINPSNTISVFYNRRVDRPNEVDIRIFPKYDDAEIIKVGNPGLRPQFTNNFEVGYKTNWEQGYVFSSLYHKQMDATITRIATTVPGSNLIYNVFQNAGKSYTTGVEIILSQNAGKWATFNLNLNGYQNIIDTFTVVNQYPIETIYSSDREEIYSGSIKFNGLFHLPGNYDVQLTCNYLAPDIIPQGKIYTRFSIDAGVKKSIQNNKGELFLNFSDLANTLKIKKEIQGTDFHFVSTDYLETQVVRIGYSYKF